MAKPKLPVLRCRLPCDVGGLFAAADAGSVAVETTRLEPVRARRTAEGLRADWRDAEIEIRMLAVRDDDQLRIAKNCHVRVVGPDGSSCYEYHQPTLAIRQPLYAQPGTGA